MNISNNYIYIHFSPFTSSFLLSYLCVSPQPLSSGRSEVKGMVHIP